MVFCAFSHAEINTEPSLRLNYSAIDSLSELRVEIVPTVFFNAYSPEIMEQYEALIELAYLEAAERFDDYLIISPEFQIEITLTPELVGNRSISSMMPGLLPGEENKEIFTIHINSNQSDDFIKGSLYYELFKAYQAELGLKNTTDEEKWLQQATAMWAVNLVDSELQFETLFNKYLYEKPCEMVDFMDDNLRKSWYQLFYYATEILSMKSFVKDVLMNYQITNDLDEAFNVSATKVQLFELFGELGQVIAVDPYDNTLILQDMSNIDESEFIITDDQIIEEENIVESSNGEWETVDLASFGYESRIIELEGSEGNKIEILNNLESDFENQTAMSVMVFEDDQWKNELGPNKLEPLAVLDLKTRDIEKIYLLFYSFAMNEAKTHDYNVSINKQIDAKGTINCQVTKSWLKIDGEPERVKDYEYTITENIKLYQQAQSEDELQTQSLVIGEVYYVDKMSIEYISDESVKYDDGESVVKTSAGQFNYNNGDAGMDLLGGNPMTDMLSETSSENSSETPGGGMEGMMGAIGSLLGGGEEDGAEGEPSMNDILKLFSPGKTEENSGEGGGEGDPSNGMNDILNLFSSGGTEGGSDEIEGLEGFDMSEAAGILSPTNQLNRIKIDFNGHSFHIYPTVPPNISSDEWISTKTVTTYFDAYGDKKTSTSTTMGYPHQNEFFPTWLHNAFYDEDEAHEQMDELPKTQEEFASQFQDMQSITSQIGTLNENFDELNLFKLLNKGTINFESSEIDSDNEGRHEQEVIFEDNEIIAHITANYVDENATEYEIHITIEYVFE